MENTVKTDILNIFESSTFGWQARLSCKENLIKALEKEFPEGPTTLAEKVYWLKFDLKDYPKCPICKGPIKSFINARKGYNLHCSCRCTQLDSSVRLKNESTNLRRYGVTNGALSERGTQKRKETCLKRYGVENPFQSTAIKEKIKQINLEKYGVENPFQNKTVREKAVKTLKQRYGVDAPCHLVEPFHFSKGEIEVYEYVKSFYSSVKHADRAAIFPMELDLYLPELKIAVEYDGDYWHSLPESVERDKEKDKICEEKGIFLIRIKESSWLANQDFIKETLRRIILNGEFKEGVRLSL